MSRRNSRHETFCREYIIDLNGTRAAIAAGYAKKGAHVTASRMLSNPKVQGRLAKLQKEKADKLDLSAEKVLGELSRPGFPNMLDYVTIKNGEALIDVSKLTREQAAAIQEITVDEYVDGRGKDAREVKRIRIKLADKNRSLENLGRHLKLFTEKIEFGATDVASDSGIEAVEPLRPAILEIEEGEAAKNLRLGIVLS